ncbi:MAG: hypothetical protein AB7T18_16260 [Alphaproteobacteria bacterium]
MPATLLFARLSNTLQKLKTPIQIFGLLIIVGGIIAYRTVPPEYVRGVFAAGSMGIFFIIFGQVFSALPSFPDSQRGLVVIMLTLIFSIYTFGALALTAYFVATAKAQTLPLRKVDQFIRPASQADVNELVHYVQRTHKCDFSIPDVQEASLILEQIKTSKASASDVEFVRSWEQEGKELKNAVCKLILAYSDHQLLPSEFSVERSKESSKAIHKDGFAVYGGSQAMDMLVATMERAETDPDRIDSYVAEAVYKLVSVGYSALYSQFRYIPQHYAEGIDMDFLKFIKQIPDSYFDIVKNAVFAEDAKKGKFIIFECGTLASLGNDGSRFVVPVASVYRKDIIDKMEGGPWPLGSAQALFSEQWWLRNAIWQMLGREHGKFRQALGTRINDYSQCGPP